VPPEETKGLLAQDLNSIQGKMLRVDVDGDDFPADSTRNYSIPSNNPFASGGGAPEIFAYGLRHPFQNGFDRATGDLYIADVGSHVSEEIDFLPAGTNGGQNFGWRAREGLVDNPDYEDPTPPGAIDPIYAYSHGSFASVIGGYVYRGSSIPWLQGTYFFADYVRQELSSFRYDGQAASELTDRTLELAGELGSLAGVASYAEDAAGELYMLDLGRGDVYRISARTSTEAGDYNQDGVVNAADYSVWRNSLGSFVTAGTSADGNKNGQVDNGDYTIWKSFYGRTVGASGAASSTALAPEPASLVLFFVGAICLGSRRRLR
jgi:glucose/arabinose dehydrogenase